MFIHIFISLSPIPLLWKGSSTHWRFPLEGSPCSKGMQRQDAPVAGACYVTKSALHQFLKIIA